MRILGNRPCTKEITKALVAYIDGCAAACVVKDEPRSFIIQIIRFSGRSCITSDIFNDGRFSIIACVNVNSSPGQKMQGLLSWLLLTAAPQVSLPPHVLRDSFVMQVDSGRNQGSVFDHVGFFFLRFSFCGVLPL